MNTTAKSSVPYYKQNSNSRPGLAVMYLLLSLTFATLSQADENSPVSQAGKQKSTPLNCLLLAPKNITSNNTFIQNLKASLENNRRLSTVVFTQNDNQGTYCRHRVAIEMTDSASSTKDIRFLIYSNNRLVEEIHKPDSLADEHFAAVISEEIATIISMNIRIRIKKFTMLGDENLSKQYVQLEETIPNMLSNGLSISPQIVLVDDIEPSELAGLLSGKDSEYIDQATFFDPYLLIANYSIEGVISELTSALFISLECKNLKTNQIIISKGINVQPIELERLQERVSELAAEVRTAIEVDYIAQRKKNKYISVVATSPYPDSDENREIALQIVRTTSQNLSSYVSQLKLDKLKVNTDISQVKKILKTTIHEDRWIMSHRLKADYLLIINLDRKDRDKLALTTTFFDANDPRNIQQQIKPIAPNEIDAWQKQIVYETVNVWLPLEDTTDNPKDKAQAVALKQYFPYQGTYKTLSFNYKIGPSVRVDRELYSGIGAGVLLGMGMTWNPSQSNRWKIEPLNLRVDALGSDGGGDRMVFGLDLIFLNANYRLTPHFSKSFYVGGGFGFLGILRNAPEDINLNGSPGLSLSFGLEQALENSKKLDWRLEFAYGLEKIDAKTVGGENFNGGRPGGLYFTLGSGF